MKPNQLEEFKEWFTEYVRGHYGDDEFVDYNIKLKECHTHRVCKEMRDLSAVLTLDENDSLIAETIALFHDVGRFPQFRQYRTYKDPNSVNHCLLALKVLAEHDVLLPLDQDERAIIEKAIEFHGAMKLPAMDERTLYFAKMIRDADKIDIFNLLVWNYRVLAEEPEKFKLELEYPDTPECNPAIINAILNQQLIDYRELKTINDAKLLQLGWVYDLYYDWSLKKLHDRGHLQAIIDLLPKTDEIKQVTDRILDYTKNRINQNPPL